MKRMALLMVLLTLVASPALTQPPGDLLGIFDLAENRLRVQLDNGRSRISKIGGQLLLRAKDNGRRVALEKAFFIGSSVRTRRGPTGRITLMLPEEITAPETSFLSPGQFMLTFPMELSYPLLDRLLGFEEVGEDFSIARKETLIATLTATIFVDGALEASLQLRITQALLGVIVGGGASLELEGTFELIPAEDIRPLHVDERNKYENCIDDSILRASFTPAEIIAVINKAKQIFAQANVVIRRKILSDDKCETVRFERSVGGGATTTPAHKGPGSLIRVGRDVIDVCRGVQQGNPTDMEIVGRALAHELGHAKSLKHKNGTVMEMCNPVDTLDEEQKNVLAPPFKDRQKSLSRKIPDLQRPAAPPDRSRGHRPGLPTPERIELEEREFEFRNDSGMQVNDLRIKFSKNIAKVTDKGTFEDVAGLGTKEIGLLDYQQIMRRAAVKIKVEGERGFKVESCQWTREGRGVAGGCTPP